MTRSLEWSHVPAEPALQKLLLPASEMNLAIMYRLCCHTGTGNRSSWRSWQQTPRKHSGYPDWLYQFTATGSSVFRDTQDSPSDSFTIERPRSRCKWHACCNFIRFHCAPSQRLPVDMMKGTGGTLSFLICHELIL